MEPSERALLVEDGAQANECAEATRYDVETLAKTPFGVPVPILDDLFLVRVPLPHNPLKALNSYVILGEDTTTIIDVGFNHPACEQALDDALAALGRSWDSVEILLTHTHPDHTGNLDRIYRDGMPVYANLHSFQEVENLLGMEETVFGPLLVQAATRAQQRDLTFEGGKPRLHVSAELLPLKNHPLVTYLKQNDSFRAGAYEFRVIETPGHDPWHICLYEPSHKLMIIGDHVLERITPSISSWFPAYNALKEFLESLGKMNAFDVDLVLPAHGAPFHDLKGRVAEIIEHHENRLQEIYELIGSGYTDILSISSHAKWRYEKWSEWALDQKFFSMGETMAHLVYLVCEGKVKQTICGGEYRFELP